MSSTTSGITLEQALTDLPAKVRVHDVAKRAGATSKNVIAALADAGVVVASAASSVNAQQATAVLTALLQPGEAAPSGAAAAMPSNLPSDLPPEPAQDPGFFAAPVFLPPAASAPAGSAPGTDAPATDKAAGTPAAEAPTTAPARRRRGAKRAADSTGQPAPVAADRSPDALPDDAVAIISGSEPVQVEAAAAETDPAYGAVPAESDADAAPARSGRRRRGRSGGRGRGDQDTDQQNEAVKHAADPVDQPADESVAALDLPDAPATDQHSDVHPAADDTESAEPGVDTADVDDEDGDQAARRRRRRGRRGRGRVGDERSDDQADTAESDAPAAIGPAVDDDAPAAVGTEDEDDEGDGDDEATDEGGTRRRRRRRRRSGSAEPVSEDGKSEDDPDNTVVHVREPRPPRETSSSSSDVQGIRGSTRLEAKRQRRRDSRGDRKRPQILTEAEFLARREAVDRVMAVRQRGDLAQVALLEDGILVEHFVSRAGSESLMGNIYLGKVQNVLPSMEAAFVDIGKGRNAVLYAGEVNWDAAGLAGKARRIETALSGGDTILVQVSKDPVGQKGARLTTQISLPGRFLVYVPGGGATGISRKLPDTERKRLKSILDRIVPEDAGVIIRTAAEGVAEEELARDVNRLKNQWEEISRHAEKKSNAPLLLSAEPDTLIKVVRDLFNSDISRLILDGERAYEPVAAYIDGVAPELADRVSRYDGPNDVFAAYRIDEQIAKALERKVYLPSGGSLVIDRTEAMTVIDVNTGKYTGSGGNLEETVTRNNLEAAEEVVRQLRLRDIGGIIVVDFIDMVLESNRELVMRRLTECLGRDRTRHQVAEVTSLGLIQMTRKKMGTGLVEAFSEPCPHCQGRGILLHDVPMEDRSGDRSGGQDSGEGDRRSRGGRGRGRQDTAVADPEPIVKIVPATVRPPDPRGPRPPLRTVGEVVPEGVSGSGHAAVEERPQPDPTTPAPRRDGTDASFNAPRSRDASDAVSAVLAALDAQAERKAAEPAPTTAVDDGQPAAEPATTGSGRRRGRRAAGRPAGAPAAVTAPAAPLPEPTATADADVLPVSDGVGTADADAAPEAAAAETVAQATGPAAGVDAAQVAADVAAEEAAHAASEFTATDIVVAPDVPAQTPGADLGTDNGAVADAAAADSPDGAPNAPAVGAASGPEAPATAPRRRRGTRAAGAAAQTASTVITAPDPVPALDPVPEAAAAPVEPPPVEPSVESAPPVESASPVESAPPVESASGAVIGNGGPPAPARRRRAASRPAGPASAPAAAPAPASAG